MEFLQHMSNHLSGIKDKRKKMAEDIFYELQGSKIKSFKVLFEVVKNELNNTSDRVIEMRLRQNKRFE